jgi:hypothetical protein
LHIGGDDARARGHTSFRVALTHTLRRAGDDDHLAVELPHVNYLQNVMV